MGLPRNIRVIKKYAKHLAKEKYRRDIATYGKHRAAQKKEIHRTIIIFWEKNLSKMD